VMHFYVERETDPARWYPRRRDGTIDVYDDLPAKYRKNVDTADAPFDRKAGDAPALNAAEIRDVIAFLGTLTDGYRNGYRDGYRPAADVGHAPSTAGPLRTTSLP
ncbi:MAG: hypothetical protein ACRYHA_22255, partial [Janthinobacterium lividum]